MKMSRFPILHVRIFKGKTECSDDLVILHLSLKHIQLNFKRKYLALHKIYSVELNENGICFLSNREFDNRFYDFSTKEYLA